MEGLHSILLIIDNVTVPGSFFNVKIPISSDTTTATAASMLLSIAAPSSIWFSSSSGAYYSSNFPLLSQLQGRQLVM